MDILIIGNGFDLAHGLETSYKQFLEFVNKVHAEDGTCYKECYERNLWMKHFLGRLYNRNDNIINKGNKWIDLETEIYNVIVNLKYHPITKPQVLSLCMVDSEFNLTDMRLRDPAWNEKLLKEGYIEPTHPHYIMYYFKDNQDLIDLLYLHLREFTKVFETYLLEEILTKEIEPFDFPLKNPYVLSFNYTDTFERLYKQDDSHLATKPKYVYVHGKVCTDEDCKLVLGTHSFVNIDPDNHQLNIPVEYNVFKKHNQRHKYNTIEPYQDFIRELSDTQQIIDPKIHIIGHSLAKTDHKILRHILKIRQDAIINVYFYDNKDEEERLINNITEILDEEDVMSRVRFIHLHNDERSILKRK